MTLHRPGCLCEFCFDDLAPLFDAVGVFFDALDAESDDAFIDAFLEDVAAIADARGLSDPPTAPPLPMGVVFGGASDPYDDRSPRGDE
jgi:hypothetical protein